MTRTPRYFMKKPVAVQAMQLTEENFKEVYEFAKECISLPIEDKPDAHKFLILNTHTGQQKLKVNDYVIKAPDGECYPLAAHVFETGFEEIN